MAKTYEMKQESFETRLKRINETIRETLDHADELHVCISNGNRKTGEVRSVSLPSVVFCKNCEKCKKSCYDFRNVMFQTRTVKSRARNAAILVKDRDRYFDEISKSLFKDRFFRWHVGGEIVDLDYLERMVKVAQENSHCTFLVFTKMYDIVNEYMDKHHEMISNLRVLFSAWEGVEMNNPYNFPTTHVMRTEEQAKAHKGAKFCSGNCTECARVGELCWVAKQGEEILFPIH